jgi:hypothetical protein
MIVARDTWHYVPPERLTPMQLLSRPKPGLYYIRLYDHDQSGTLPPGRYREQRDRQATDGCLHPPLNQPPLSFSTTIPNVSKDAVKIQVL